MKYEAITEPSGPITGEERTPPGTQNSWKYRQKRRSRFESW